MRKANRPATERTAKVSEERQDTQQEGTQKYKSESNERQLGNEHQQYQS